jgi:hypothetical protein
MTNYIGNISTLIKIISMTAAGWIITALAAHGYNLGVDAATLASVIGAVIGLILAYIDAKYPNTLSILGNAPVPVEEDLVLNDEYETGDEDDDI